MHTLAVLLLAALLTLAHPTARQATLAADSKRKALFVFNFMHLVQWPADAFQHPSEALRVQITGRDPFDGWLDRLLAGKVVQNRRVIVTHTSVPIFAPLPHVLFVSATEEPQLARLLAAFCRSPVLTVSDLDRFANRGGVIGIVEQDHNLHFAINQTAATEARLQVGSKLFHLAVPLFSAISPCGIPTK